MSNFNRFVSVLTILSCLVGVVDSDDRRAAYAEKADKLFEEGNYERRVWSTRMPYRLILSLQMSILNWVRLWKGWDNGKVP